MYMDSIRQTYSDQAQLVALLDKDKTRMAGYNERSSPGHVILLSKLRIIR